MIGEIGVEGHSLVLCQHAALIRQRRAQHQIQIAHRAVIHIDVRVGVALGLHGPHAGLRAEQLDADVFVLPATTLVVAVDRRDEVLLVEIILIHGAAAAIRAVDRNRLQARSGHDDRRLRCQLRYLKIARHVALRVCRLCDDIAVSAEHEAVEDVHERARDRRVALLKAGQRGVAVLARAALLGDLAHQRRLL